MIIFVDVLHTLVELDKQTVKSYPLAQTVLF